MTAADQVTVEAVMVATAATRRAAHPGRDNRKRISSDVRKGSYADR
jgi:hypothetical protein